jgi:hypothetical protein
MSARTVILTCPCEQAAVTSLARCIGRRPPQRAFSVTHVVPLSEPVIAVIGYKPPEPESRRFQAALLTLLHGEEADPAIVAAVANAAIRSIEAFGYNTFFAASDLPAASVRALKQRGWQLNADHQSGSAFWRRRISVTANDHAPPESVTITSTPPVTGAACNARE